MTKEAHLPGGVVLEFPDETPDAVMDRAVRTHLSEARAEQTRARTARTRATARSAAPAGADASAGVETATPTGRRDSWRRVEDASVGVPIENDALGNAAAIVRGEAPAARRVPQRTRARDLEDAPPVVPTRGPGADRSRTGVMARVERGRYERGQNSIFRMNIEADSLRRQAEFEVLGPESERPENNWNVRVGQSLNRGIGGVGLGIDTAAYGLESLARLVAGDRAVDSINQAGTYVGTNPDGAAGASLIA